MRRKYGRAYVTARLAILKSQEERKQRRPSANITVTETGAGVNSKSTVAKRAPVTVG